MSCSAASTTPAKGRRRPERVWCPRAEGLATLVTIVCLVVAVGCRTATLPPAMDAAALADARETLGKPLSGDLAALYHLRVPSTGALRLAVINRGGDGRMTISEPFGGAVSVTSWTAGQPSRHFDLRRGCWQAAGDAIAGLGVTAMPLPQAVRLLGGRLPAVRSDRIVESADGRLDVIGPGWRALVTVAPDPWRVTSVDEVTPGGEPGWRVRLNDHTGSVPGTIRIESPDRAWAELELLRLEWDGGNGLPEEPDLPPCGAVPDGP